MLSNYLHIYGNAKVRFHAFDMQPYVNSDTAYLVALKTRSYIATF